MREALLTGGELNAAVTREVVRIHTAILGRGPKKSYTFHTDTAVVTVMEEVMTRAERSLVESGDGELVTRMRHRLQQTMSEELKAAVESLTDRRVIAFLSDNHLDPDLAVEIFLLDGPLN